MIRGNAVLGRAEAACHGVLLAAITGGSALVFVAASPRVYQEDIAWSAALTIGSVFALIGVLERPSRGRVVASGLLVLATALDRSPTGYACIVGALLIAVWFGVGRAGEERRRWAGPMAAVGIGSLAVMAFVNAMKFGAPFGLPEADQVWTHVNAHRRAYLAANGGSPFNLSYLPTTLWAYFRPSGLSVSSVFPFLTLPTAPAGAVGNVVLDQTYPTASVPASMPLVFLLACWGVVTSFRPHAIEALRGVRLVLVATAAGCAGVLLFGFITERYLADFLPFLALAAMIGTVDLWRRLQLRSRRARTWVLATVVALGVFSIWANIGAAVTPTSLWTPVQASGFVSAQRSLGGTASVRKGDRLPYWAPAESLFIAGDCSGLYLSTGFSYATVPGQQLQHMTWLPVEQSVGINHVVDVEFTRPVTQTDGPLPILTWGPTSVELVPVGADRVRISVVRAGAPSVTWPTSTSDPASVVVGHHYHVAVTTDPNLQSITVAGIGGGIQRYLAGSGPAHVATGANGPITVGQVPQGVPTMSLCRALLPTAKR